jgi:hypothetical protein
MLNNAEQTTQNIMTKYDNDVQILTKQVRIYIIKDKIFAIFALYSLAVFNKNTNDYNRPIEILEKLKQ